MKKVICMGVAGCGKSSIGEAVAEQFGWVFIEGDELHSVTNVEKMSRGEALTDDDRGPWLQRIGEQFATAPDNTSGMVVSCSALRRNYRDRINEFTNGEVFFLHLHTEQSVIAQRIAARQGHFMPPSLLDSQYQTLEQLGADEYGAVIDIAGTMDSAKAAGIAALESRLISAS